MDHPIPPAAWSHPTSPRNPWALPAWGLALLSALPLLVILGSWINPAPEVWSHLMATRLPEVVANTVWMLLGVGVGVLLLGVGLAALVALCDFPGRRFFDWALVLPLAIPAYVLAFTLLGFTDHGGPLRTLLTHQFGPKGYWFPNVRSTGGVCLVLTLVFYPYVYLLARSAFLSQGRQLLEASRVLGLGPWGAFFHAALPMARPAIAAGTALALMESLADFGAVAVFNYDTFTTAIYKAWFGLFNLQAAAQLASLLLLFVAAAMTLERSTRGKTRYFSGQRSSGPPPLPLRGGWGWLATTGAGLVFLLAFALPVGQLLAWTADALAHDLDARYFALLLHTLTLGGLAALFTLSGAVILAMARRQGAGARRGRWIASLAVRLATLGYALPGSVLAVGVMLVVVGVDKTLSEALGISGRVLGGGIAGLLFAYGVRFLAVAFGPVESGLERIRPSLEEAARGLGASGGEMLRRVVLPILRPSLLTAALLTLVEVMKEMPATLLLRPFGWETLAVRIFEMTSEGEWERAALPAITLVLVGMGPVILLVRKSAAH
ncbi:MAG: iron ABC transporter permease [Magnetococcales bacterium]|nr:iron ABC transporter permease [Magnetococcales bacterium]